MPGMRKEIHKEETNNCYGYASWRVEIKALEDQGGFIRVLKKEFPRAKCVSMIDLYTQ